MGMRTIAKKSFFWRKTGLFGDFTGQVRIEGGHEDCRGIC
jgi:hypothetical protein